MKQGVKQEIEKETKQPVKVVQQTGEKESPLGVKILSILHYIGAGLSVLLGLLFLIIGIIALLNPNFIEIPETLATVGGIGNLVSFIGLFILGMGILFLLMAVLDFFIARGLWKGQNWARILVIIFSGLAIILAIISLIKGNWMNILNLIIGGVVGGYLWFSKDVKGFFSKKI